MGYKIKQRAAQTFLKICRHCTKNKPHRLSNQSRCVDCWGKHSRAWFASHKGAREKHEAKRKTKRQKFKRNAKLRKLRLENPEWREHHVSLLTKSATKRKFGLSLDELEAMKLRQGGCCAICGELPKQTRLGRIRAHAIDHDHATGKIRELLCSKCNTGIGLFSDSPMILYKAFRYLLDHGKKI